MKQTQRSGKNIAGEVRKVIDGAVAELGYALWDVEFVKEGATYFLRITIDSPDGITIDDCEKVHRAIDPLLDAADPIEQAYTLEVSSPGIERELKTDVHISACTGWDVEVKLYAPQNGSKVFRGVLDGLDGSGRIGLVLPSGEVLAFEKEAVAKINTVFDFDDAK